MTKASVPLQSLPLRPSALGILLRAGFRTADDVRSSSRSGLGNFAAECTVGLSEAGRLRREVEEAAAAAGSTGSSGADATAAAGQVRPRPRPGSSRRITAAALLTDPHAASGTSSDASSGRKGSSSPSGQNNIRHIVTFCRSIDALLGGGVALSELTELSGAPGSGKTQLAMQLCIDARLPPAYGGVGGQAVYVDTEGSFSSERCWDMAEALVRHVRRSAERRARNGSAGAGTGGGNASSSNADASADLPEWFNPASILDGIHVLRVHDLAAQQAAVHNLSALLRSKLVSGETPIKAVVIDSVAFHYRSEPSGGGSSYGGRTKSLTRLAASLADLAREFDVAVLAVNQMTTKVQGGGIGGGGGPLGESSANGGATSSSSSRLTPALGESWSHATTTRLLLTQVKDGESSGGDLRRCRLVKCPHKAAGVADFQVNEYGVRDVAVAAAGNANANAPPPGGSGQQGTAAVEQAKRQRVQ